MDETTMLVPLDSTSTERDFDVVLRGYDRAQVDRHLDYVETLLAQATARLRTLEHEAASEAASLSWEKLGRRVTEILALAEQEAQDIRRQAHEDVDSLEQRVSAREAEVEAQCADRQRTAETIAAQVADAARADAERVRREAREEAERLLAGAREQADRLVGEASTEADQIRTAVRGETEQMRRLAEEDVVRLARRRDSIRHELESLHQRLATAMSGGTEG